MIPKRKNKIYLDYSATTPVDPRVAKKMMPYFSKEYGNPSSIHQFGQKALGAIDEARQKIASFLGCKASEIVFTGSATEANNLAIKGVVYKLYSINPNFKPHIITTKIEHDSILKVCEFLEREGVEVTYLSPTTEGIVQPKDIQKALKENTALVSVMYANNEIGTIQPITEISKVIESFRRQNSKLPGLNYQLPLFHTDAVQAVNYLDCNVNTLGVDLLTVSGHKIYGPKGVGALYVKTGIVLEPILHGGGQEKGLRSGTENVPAIVGLGEAISLVSKLKTQGHVTKLINLRDRLISGILKSIPEAKLNGSRKHRLPNNINFYFPGVDSETLIIALDQKGIAVSSGSACSTRSIEPSHVLLAIGLSPQQAKSCLRITLGRYTTKDEIDYFLKVLPSIIKKIKILS